MNNIYKLRLPYHLRIPHEYSIIIKDVEIFFNIPSNTGNSFLLPLYGAVEINALAGQVLPNFYVECFFKILKPNISQHDELEMIRTAINIFIEKYRIIASDFVNIRVVDKFNRIDFTELDITLNNSGETKLLKRSQISSPNNSSISEDELTKIKDLIEGNCDMPFYKESLGFAEVALAKEWFRESVVNSVIALDSFLDKLLKKYFKETSILIDKKNNKRKKYADYSRPPMLGIKLKFYEEKFGISLYKESRSVDLDLKSKIDLRNDIIHNDKIIIGGEESEKVLSAIKEIIKFLIEKVGDPY